MKTFYLSLIFIHQVVEYYGENGVCFPSLECYSQDEPWVSALRPFPAPQPPEEINVRFFLLTRNTGSGASIETNQITMNSDYTPNLMSLNFHDYLPQRPLTVFIIHGFFANIKRPWMHQMAKVYLSRADANIFLIDWGKGADKINYLQAAANTRVVGDIIARFLTTLIQTMHLHPMQLHLVGHSLGSHCLGYAAKKNPGIYRITALDAASPGFEGCPGEVRLNKGDAKYIDVIHTNGEPIFPSFGFGYMSSLGDVDFRFNGGASQPECFVPPKPQNTPGLNPLLIPFDELVEWITCSHRKSISYFIEAIEKPNCVMWGHKQKTAEKIADVVTEGVSQRFEDDTCDLEKCSPVGLETFLFPGRGDFYVVTNFSSPYCKAEPKNTSRMKALIKYHYYSQDSN